MSAEVIIGLISSLVGGAFVSLITYLSTRKRTEAEAKKLEAEAERTMAETAKLLLELDIQKSETTFNKDIPSGWFVSGSRPGDYEMGVDHTTAYSGNRSGYIKGHGASKGFGTLMQSFFADNFLGKRLRLSGYVKTEGVKDWANLWMRVDGAKLETLSFDNMKNRPIKGTTDWTKYSIVLDVPEKSTQILFGVMLSGSGQVWVDEMQFEIVKNTVQTTNMVEKAKRTRTEPVNLDFESN